MLLQCCPHKWAMITQVAQKWPLIYHLLRTYSHIVLERRISKKASHICTILKEMEYQCTVQSFCTFCPPGNIMLGLHGPFKLIIGTDWYISNVWSVSKLGSIIHRSFFFFFFFFFFSMHTQVDQEWPLFYHLITTGPHSCIWK